MTASPRYLGPFTITQIERHIGDFDSVWVKPHETRMLRGPEGQRPLYPVGVHWPCGCDARRPSYELMRTSRWAPCPSHHANAACTGAPACAVPEDQTRGLPGAAPWATMRDGWHLFEAEPGLAVNDLPPFGWRLALITQRGNRGSWI